MPKPIQLSTLSTLPEKGATKKNALDENIKLTHELSVIQDKLYAQNKYSVLIILQGMDTAGKDSAVKHVFSGVNPAGCNIKSFKVPSSEETSHHFMWRIASHCPAKGMIQIFNRSHYEDIIMPMLAGQLSEKTLKARCREINVFETGLVNNNTILLKFYLHISQAEQLKRLDDRKTDPAKLWKFQKDDAKDIKMHDNYKTAYEFIFKHASESRWHLIPADKKWFKNNLILKTIITELHKYKIDYPGIAL